MLLHQEILQPKVPIIQRSRVPVPFPMNSSNLSDTDSDDSNDDAFVDKNISKPKKNNTKFYYKTAIFLCWLAVQYWMFAVAGFGAVFFACSALVAIYLNTSNSHGKKNILSAYSVFNPQCTPIQGSADPKQLERELIFGGL